MLPTGAPVEHGIVGSSCGWRADPISGQSALHTGLDFQADQGAPILAAAGGVVVTQEFHSAYGNMLENDHGDDLIVKYAHAVKMLVKKGDLIRSGQLIGEVGTTVRSTGSHLHFAGFDQRYSPGSPKILRCWEVSDDSSGECAFKLSQSPRKNRIGCSNTSVVGAE